MLLTIAIPTYNNEKTIARAIHSSINQDYDDDYEILIANNSSTDRTLEVIESFKDKKIRVITNSETYDMYTNHNICLREAKGDYVLFCHSDDELLPHTLKVISAKLKERFYPSKFVLWGHSVFRDFYYSIEKGKQNLNTVFGGSVALDCFMCGGLTPSGTCYSRKSLLDIGGFPVSKSRAPEMDWAILIIAAFNHFEFEMIDRLVFKRTGPSTAFTNLSRKEETEIHRDTFRILFSNITEEQKSLFVIRLLVHIIRNISCHSLDILDALKDYLPYKKYLLSYMIIMTRRILHI